jgi:hypothetical protein
MAEVKHPVSSEPAYIKEHLLKQIDNLKADIQILLTKKKTLDNKDEIKVCMEDKKRKMDQLKVLNDKLKDIHKKERLEVQKRNELISITRAIDNIEFGAAKRKNNAIAMEKAKMAKAQRDEVRNKYLEFQEIEKVYSENDCKRLPGVLFLHKNVLKNYGLCPYIEFDKIDDDKLYEQRNTWLQSQEDSGVLYFDVYRQLVEKQDLIFMETKHKNMENDITNFIKSILTPSQTELYDSIYNFLQEYTGCNIKTKRLKERLKTTINDLSILYSETGLEIHTYLSIRYDFTIVVNIIESKENLTMFERLQRSMSVEKFVELLEHYKKLLSDIENEKKFTTNWLKNLKTDLYNYLTDKQSFINRSDIHNSKKNTIVQIGQYFKKWSALTDDERLERFDSYATFYVDKHLVESNILNRDNRDQYLNDLKKLLTDSFKSKKLLYKHISWNVKRGFIDSIKVLKYTDDNSFRLNIEENTNKNTTTSSDSKTTLTDRLKDKTTDTPKKKVSIRTIITKESGKIINEELLYFILKRVNGKADVEPTKEDKELVAERIKTKLKVKKLTSNDKKIIFEKYDEIFNIVKNNDRQ